MGKNDKGGCPRIGDEVTICTGAVVVGDISIADRVLIAANAVVTDDVDENVSVGGVPARIIARNHSFSLKEYSDKNL